MQPRAASALAVAHTHAGQEPLACATECHNTLVATTGEGRPHRHTSSEQSTPKTEAFDDIGERAGSLPHEFDNKDHAASGLFHPSRGARSRGLSAGDCGPIPGRRSQAQRSCPPKLSA
jgi:hypothetical protein